MTGPPPRDWDRELADIDRMIAKAPAPVPGPRAAPAPPVSRPPAPRGTALGTWLRVGLGVALAAAVTQWPYGQACGTRLFVYLGVVGMVVLAGLWGAGTTWGRRHGFAHVVSLLVMLWGLFLAAAAVLPRIGYARDALPWFC